MGLSRLKQDISLFNRIALDTAPVIYFVEGNSTYEEFVNFIFRGISAGNFSAFTSTITLIEVLIAPLGQGDSHLTAIYQKLLLNSKNFSTVDIDPDIGMISAELRAKHKIKVPDAIQLAVAINCNCDVFVTNDSQLKRVKDIPVIVLDDYL